LSDFLLDLHQSLAHQGLAKTLDISIGMPTLFANLAASRSWHISSQKITQLRSESPQLQKIGFDPEEDHSRNGVKSAIDPCDVKP